MVTTNADIARAFSEVADLLELQGANPFRVRAYRNAARVLDAHGPQVGDLLAAGQKLTGIPGIGADLAGKAAELVRTGRLAALEAERAKVPPGLRDLLAVEGLGPKRVQRLREELGVADLAGLGAAARAGRIRELGGFGRRSEAKILASLRRVQDRPSRALLCDVEPVAEELVARLRAVAGVQAEAAGSFRRRRETVGDLDVVAAAHGPARLRVMQAFAAAPGAEAVVSRGPTRATVRLRSGLGVDLRVVEPGAFGAALLYFTGSKAHNIRLRRMAMDRGLKLSEYGLFRKGRRLAGRTEEEVYAALGLPPVPPELREDHGEIDAAARGALPTLVRRSDLRGDLHAHTDASDGQDGLARMAKAAQAAGLEYLAITDHSPRTTIAKGLPEPAMARHLERIRRLGRKLESAGGPALLAGAEVDVLPGGRLDYGNRLLARMDVVVASLHHRGKMDDRGLNAAVLRVVSNPRVHILGHPTGRLIGRRDAMAIDLDAVLEAARDHHVALECNSQPDRLDLDDAQMRHARGRGVPIAVSSDAHSVSQLGDLRRGIDQARRGGLERKDVLNTRSLAEIRTWLAK